MSSSWCSKCQGWLYPADAACYCELHTVKDLDHDDEVEFWGKGSDEEAVAEAYAERFFDSHDYRTEWDLEIKGVRVQVTVESVPSFSARKVVPK